MFEKLPVEINKHIFSFFRANDLKNFALVSTYAYKNFGNFGLFLKEKFEVNEQVAALFQAYCRIYANFTVEHYGIHIEIHWKKFKNFLQKNLPEQADVIFQQQPTFKKIKELYEFLASRPRFHFYSLDGRYFYPLEAYDCLEHQNHAVFFSTHEDEWKDKTGKLYIHEDRVELIKSGTFPPSEEISVTYSRLNDKLCKEAILIRLFSEGAFVALEYPDKPLFLLKTLGNSENYLIVLKERKNNVYKIKITIATGVWSNLELKYDFQEGVGIGFEFMPTCPYKYLFCSYEGNDHSCSNKSYLISQQGEEIQLKSISLQNFNFDSIGLSIKELHKRITPLDKEESNSPEINYLNI